MLKKWGEGHAYIHYFPFECGRCAVGEHFNNAITNDSIPPPINVLYGGLNLSKSKAQQPIYPQMYAANIFNDALALRQNGTRTQIHKCTNIYTHYGNMAGGLTYTNTQIYIHNIYEQF